LVFDFQQQNFRQKAFVRAVQAAMIEEMPKPSFPNEAYIDSPANNQGGGKVIEVKSNRDQSP
jgi:hypothetical protein